MKEQSEVRLRQAKEWFGLFLVALATFALASLLTHDPEDYGGMRYPPPESVHNQGQRLGAALSWFLLAHFGIGAFLLVPLVGLVGVLLFLGISLPKGKRKLLASAILVGAVAVLGSLLLPRSSIGEGHRVFGATISLGGMYGEVFARILREQVGFVGAFLAVFLVLVAAGFVATDWVLEKAALRALRAAGALVEKVQPVVELAARGLRKLGDAFLCGLLFVLRRMTGMSGGRPRPEKPAPREVVRDFGEFFEAPLPAAGTGDDVTSVAPKVAEAFRDSKETAEPREVWTAPRKEPFEVAQGRRVQAAAPPQPLPPLEFFELSDPPPVDPGGEEIRRCKATIERVLSDFHIAARVVDYQTGPVVTLYELELEPGIKVQQVQTYSETLAVSLKVSGVLVRYPLPNRSTVGIEVPNRHRGLVRLREALGELREKSAAARPRLPLILGMDALGRSVVLDLAEMPHLLIAGTTGSGKSVCMNAIILSLLSSRSAEDLKLILVDPKMVELSVYQEIPHLLCPVVTESKKAAAVLDRVARYMEERYDRFAGLGVKNIEQHNALGAEEISRRLGVEADQECARLPYLVVIIDELADLMWAEGRQIEHAVVRLSAKSRAVGIHLVLATQRPSVDVVTGLIKSNMPARIAFKVASRVDARVILDQQGADKLLGKGDLLLMTPANQDLLRVQGTFVSEQEVSRVVDFLRAQGEPHYDQEVALVAEKGAVEEIDENDPLFEQAVDVVVAAGRGSVTLLQRRLEVGYPRAARVMEALEKRGIVGPGQGATPREVLITLEQWQERKKGKPAAAASFANPPEADSEDRSAVPAEGS